MRLFTGVDLIELVRVGNAIDRHGTRFTRRIFTDYELMECEGRLASLAARFAAKEAVAKALGTGIGQIGWQDIEVRYGAANQPELHLRGAAQSHAAKKGVVSWSISISHTDQVAVAMVVGYAPA